MAQLEQRHRAGSKIIHKPSLLADWFALKFVTSRGYLETLKKLITVILTQHNSNLQDLSSPGAAEGYTLQPI